MPGVHIGAGAKVYRSIVAEKVNVEAGTETGSLDSETILLVAENVKKGE
jgi:glucose-1-phosphate adenylyltransferase